MKKGVELSMNVIIIAAIGLLVLVILAVLVIQAGTKTVEGTKNCNSAGGICSTGCDSESILADTSGCEGSKPYCCKAFSIE
ncbi:MAG: hypothetical protein ACP5N1_01670 [Candidatus Woesearchaeota archaeon]